MPDNDRLSEKWPWNGEFLRLALIVPGTGGLVATMVALPFAGLHALWFLSAVIAGVVWYAVYGVVGRKVRVDELNEGYGRPGEPQYEWRCGDDDCGETWTGGEDDDRCPICKAPGLVGHEEAG